MNLIDPGPDKARYRKHRRSGASGGPCAAAGRPCASPTAP